MSSALNFVALISGGKDSLFSILHCLANGHELVALANLYPDGSSVYHGGDTNSYMYQTVGHDVIPLYEGALDVPLYRQPIRGTAICTKKEYTQNFSERPGPGKGEEEDETESLVPLLRHVMRMHPHVNAVSTGAILSTYQRTRVESVAIRLGLIPLSYLWQYPSLPPYTQSSLLIDMAAVGQRSLIIKVASGGLDDSFLGEDVAAQRTVTRLKRIMKRFSGGDGAILGEGGEFETLALDGPRPLWKKKVCVDIANTVRDDGGSALVEFHNTRLEEKGNHDLVIDFPKHLRKPDLFDDEFRELARRSDLEAIENRDDNTNSCYAEFDSNLPMQKVKFSFSQTENLLSFANMYSIDDKSDAAQQLERILEIFAIQLIERNMSPLQVILCSLQLRSMSDFNAVNSVYQSFFSGTNPPARVTIACGEALTRGINVSLAVLLSASQLAGEDHRRALHVQSRSYWAPANIGPYSQAVALKVPQQGDTTEGSMPDSSEEIYLAGQIPLDPATMKMYCPNFSSAAALALQHVWRIGRDMKVIGWCAAVAIISQCNMEQAQQKAITATDVWKGLHESMFTRREKAIESTDIDVWDMRNNPAMDAGADTESDGRPALPNVEKIAPNSTLPPCFVAEVSELPKGADIEWVSHGISNGNIRYYSLEDGKNSKIHVVEAEATRTFYLSMGIRDNSDLDRINNVIREWTGCAPGQESSKAIYTVYYAERLTSSNWLQGTKPMMVPCRSVWERERRLRAIVLVTTQKAIAK